MGITAVPYDIVQFCEPEGIQRMVLEYALFIIVLLTLLICEHHRSSGKSH